MNKDKLVFRELNNINGWLACSNGKIYSNKANRFLSGRKLDTGYIQVGTTINGKVKLFREHILICQAFHGLPKEGMTVNHINFVRDDNRPENLEWTTLQDNINKSVLAGRRLRKLTPDLIRKIRLEYKPWDRKHSGSVVAKKYGLHRSYIYTLFKFISCKNIL